MEILGIIYLTLSVLIPITIIGSLVYFLINSSKKKEGLTFSTKTLFQTYLHFIMFATLIFAVIGGSTAIRAATSYPFGIDFSYTLYKANNFEEQAAYDDFVSRDNFEECYEGEVTVINGAEYCENPSQRTRDLVNGITIFISMAILFLIHQFTIKKINKEEKVHWLAKVYTFASLILYSIIGIIVIPVSIYQLTNFLFFSKDTSSYTTPEAPAMALALAIFAIPLWVLFLKQTSKLKE